MTTRREFLYTLTSLTAGLALTSRAAYSSPTTPTWAGLKKRFAELERSSSGRLGFALLDTANGARIAHRGDERFPMCSTFKFLAVAAVLSRIDQGKEQLDRRINYTRNSIVPYSPFTEKHTSDGMTVRELCEAAMIVSDNTAANLLLETFGGPSGVTAFARLIGDTKTRLDRNEPSLNEALRNDVRDTTTPTSMASNLNKLVLGNTLSDSSRKQLTDWLLQNKTGDKRLRAGLPSDWKVGDKTGTGRRGTSNDIAILWPPNRPPIIVAVYLTEAKVSDDERNNIIATVGKEIAAVVK